uniref:Uncharacterized protein n=1 Tax=Arion vulgaris TaxID=1028688 RepID=A0A0B7AQ61_9EUPU
MIYGQDLQPINQTICIHLLNTTTIQQTFIQPILSAHNSLHHFMSALQFCVQIAYERHSWTLQNFSRNAMVSSGRVTSKIFDCYFLAYLQTKGASMGNLSLVKLRVVKEDWS